MLKLEGSVTLALIFCSSAALARDPEPAMPEAFAPIEQEPPRTLHRQPLEPDEVAPVAPPEPKANQAASDGFLSPFTMERPRPRALVPSPKVDSRITSHYAWNSNTGRQPALTID